MEIEITIEEIIKLMKALVGKEEQNKLMGANAPEVFEATSDSQVTAPVVTGSSKTAKREPWTPEAKAWLFAQDKPCAAKDHVNELQQRFGVKRTDKSISGVWRRLHDTN